MKQNRSSAKMYIRVSVKIFMQTKAPFRTGKSGKIRFREHR